MQANKCVGCKDFPCVGVKHECYVVPGIDIQPDEVSIVMISEAAPADPADYYYASGEPLFQQTTVQAFNDTGADVSSIQDIVDLGVYLTTAVKCGKIGYGIKAGPIKECSLILEKELALFPNVQVFMLMGDVAIKAINYIARGPVKQEPFPPVPRTRSGGKNIFSGGGGLFPPTCRPVPAFSSKRARGE